jgi:hypothetical protein
MIRFKERLAQARVGHLVRGLSEQAIAFRFISGSVLQPWCRCAWAIVFSVLQGAGDGLSRNPIGHGAPVFQVQDDRLQASNSRAANTLQNAPRGEKPPPEPHVSLPKLFRAHPRRAEGHGVLAVVVTLGARQQPARPLEFLEDRRFRKRRQDADRRAVPYA